MLRVTTGNCQPDWNGWGCVEHWIIEDQIFHIGLCNDDLVVAIWKNKQDGIDFGARISVDDAVEQILNKYFPIDPVVVKTSAVQLLQSIAEIEGL